MISITILALALSAVSLCQAAASGQYRPELYAGGQYNSLAQRNSKYGTIYNAYDPFYYQAFNRDFASPLRVNYADSIDSTPFPTTVTIRPPVVTTYRTPVVSTYRTPVVSTYHPVVYSTPKPFTVNTVTKAPSAVYLKSGPDGAANIIRQDRTFDENNYHFAYETDNGIAAEESGVVDSAVNGVGGGTRVRGFYEYIGDDGQKYRVDYIADENGYRASGAHLPKAP